MILALVVLVIAALAFAAGHFYAGRAANSVLAAQADRFADRGLMLNRATERVMFLENTIDEIRARELETTPPVPPNKPAPISIPEEVQAEIDMIEDDEGRDEYTAQVLLCMENYPEMTPEAIINRVFR